jgi:hypothetical protein
LHLGVINANVPYRRPRSWFAAITMVVYPLIDVVLRTNPSSPSGERSEGSMAFLSSGEASGVPMRIVPLAVTDSAALGL